MNNKIKFIFFMCLLSGIFYSCEPEQLPENQIPETMELDKSISDSGNEQNEPDKREPDEEKVP